MVFDKDSPRTVCLPDICANTRRSIRGIRFVLSMRLIAWTALFALLSSCGGGSSSSNTFFTDPSTTPIKSMLKTAVPVAYAISIAMQAVQGNAPTNPTSVTVDGGACTVYPCSRRVTINIAAGDLPMEFGSYGSIDVFGSWTTANDAIVTTSFTGMHIGSGDVIVVSLAAAPVSVTASGIRFVYANVDINVDTNPDTLTSDQIQAGSDRYNATPPTDVEVSVDMDGWIVSVDNVGTPLDFSDDEYQITGGSQGVSLSAGITQAYQLGILNVRITPACDLNPIDGDVFLQLVSSSTSTVVGQALFYFDTTCDGQANVSIANGSYLTAIGKSYPLNLNTD